MILVLVLVAQVIWKQKSPNAALNCQPGKAGLAVLRLTTIFAPLKERKYLRTDWYPNLSHTIKTVTA